MLKKISCYNYFASEESQYFIKDFLNNKSISITELQNEYEVKCFDKDFFLRKIGSDLNVFKQIFFKEEYYPLVQTININNIEVNNLIDAGANIGLTTLYLKKYFPKLHCICIEPDINNFNCLSKNIDKSNLNDVSLINAALWYNNEKLALDTSFRDGESWSLTFHSNTKNPKLTDAITIREIIVKYQLEKIDIFKIDIEGAERYIFDKELNDLDFLKITKILVIEIHDEFEIRDKIYSILKTFNFSLYNSGELTICINSNIG